ncbi:5374_t:CDS:2 [Rhizophagus irregularis]|nr:5374_t:CDS:2 [Rhizophagus irregularis]
MTGKICFVLCIITLSFTLCIITQVNADTEHLPPSKKVSPPLIEEAENNNSDQINTENLNPVFWILGILYNVFILTPYTITQKINSYFYPLYMFLTSAALIGILVGGMAGWFSEVITKLLISSTSDELAYEEQENNRIKAEKLKRRAQALANYKARNGGRMPEEFYDKYYNVQNKQGIIQQRGMMEGSYEGSGVGEI